MKSTLTPFLTVITCIATLALSVGSAVADQWQNVLDCRVVDYRTGQVLGGIRVDVRDEGGWESEPARQLVLYGHPARYFAQAGAYGMQYFSNGEVILPLSTYDGFLQAGLNDGGIYIPSRLDQYGIRSITLYLTNYPQSSRPSVPGYQFNDCRSTPFRR